MGGRVLTLGNPIVRRCLAAPITCCLLVTMLLVEPATAEEGIAAGSSAVITAGAPLAVRAAPGWDAAVSYEIADGTAITVWDVAQVAPDGSLWYPVDGGFVPVDAVSSVSTLKGDVALYQDTTQDVATGEWVDPALADPAAAAAPEQVNEPAATEEWVDPVTGKSFDPATVEAVAAAPVDAVPVDAAPSDAPTPVNTLGTGETEPWGEPIATAYIAGTRGDGAPCLTAPDWQSATLAVLGEGEAVPVRAETMGEWQPVDCAGAGGYVHASFIAWTQMAAPEEGDDGGRREREAGHGGGASNGNEIVDFAMRYEGHPYVYAGDGPRAFDCSGFTMFVIGKTLGIDITHDMFVQYDMGSQVGRNDLQPGDLVFFKNTFRRGLSHTGIYIGGGQFIHAENESTGVRISDLDSDYYSSRWYGAVRYS
jgi:cell wall-associated NlpC family hydrolase